MDSSNLLTQCEFSLQVINKLKSIVTIVDTQEMTLVGANQAFFSFFDKEDLADFKDTYICISHCFESVEKEGYLSNKYADCSWISQIIDKSKVYKAVIKGQSFKAIGSPINERYAIATFYDITEMIHQEKELEQLRAQQMKEYVNKASFLHEIELVSSIALPALIVNGKDRLTAYNKAFVALFDLFEDKQTIEKIKTKQLNIGETFLLNGESICKSAFIDWKEDRLDVQNDEADIIEILISSQQHSFHIYVSKLQNQDERFLLILHRNIV